MSQAKTKELKVSLNNEFRLIHELCLFVLNASQRGDLIRATLSCYHAYLSWIPLGYIFESNLLEMLLKLFPQPHLRNLTLQCLAEVRCGGCVGGSSFFATKACCVAVLSSCMLNRKSKERGQHFFILVGGSACTCALRAALSMRPAAALLSGGLPEAEPGVLPAPGDTVQPCHGRPGPDPASKHRHRRRV